MLRNYIKIAWRNLSQHKSYTFINLTGLAVGMACCILISLYIKEELSYDTFHEKSDRIAAVGISGGFFGSTLATPYPLADALAGEIPEVEAALRMQNVRSLYLSRDRQDFTEIKPGKYAEPSFFEIFSFELISGDREQALAAPNTIVLSESNSRQLFGSQNPVGETLYWQQRDTLMSLEVTGVIEDEAKNSSVNYGALISFTTLEERRRDPEAWTSFFLQTFVLLRSPEAFAPLPAKLDTLAKAKFEEREERASLSIFTIPLGDYHLSEETRNEGFTGNRAYLYLFGSVALFILVIACVNYINLATARASLRSKEVGVRKTLGAGRLQVAGQFIGESIILSVGAYVTGALAALLVLPFFNQLFGTSLGWQSSGAFLGWLVMASVIVGMVAGLYPSFYLSRFSPVSVLRNRGGQSGSGSFLRKSLVVAQFGVALVLIIGSLIVYQQLQYVQTKDLGFEGEQVVSVNLPNREAWDRRDIIRDQLAGHSGILEISAASGTPGRFNIRMGYTPEEFSPEAKVESEENLIFAPAVVDYDFLDLLDIEVIAGRNFSREMGSDRERGYILNRKAAELLGWTPEEAIGKPLTMGSEDADGEVIGITENFHISSLHNEIEGVVLQLQPSGSWYGGGSIVAKLAPDMIPETMDFIEKEVKPFSPNTSFDYEFLDDRFDAMYRTERRFSQIVTIFTFIAIIIGCLGLYGLAAFSAERRTKEIGIRKVLGATVTHIVALLSKDFLKLVFLGFVIAVPIAWYAMNQWLADFAFRIDIGAGIFVIAGLTAVLVALGTVSWQSIRAAVANPVESLRSE